MTVLGWWSLTFLVDGASLLVMPAQQLASWVPGERGFYAIAMLDAMG